MFFFFITLTLHERTYPCTVDSDSGIQRVVGTITIGHCQKLMRLVGQSRIFLPPWQSRFDPCNQQKHHAINACTHRLLKYKSNGDLLELFRTPS